MAKHTSTFTVASSITLEHHDGAQNSSLKHADLDFTFSGNIDRSVYKDGKGLPRQAAFKPMINCLIAGLVTTIKQGDTKGWMKEDEAMAYAVDLLQRLFASKPDLGEADSFIKET